MSLQLLKTLNGNNTGSLQQFINQFVNKKKEPRICWYPSAGRDFKPLLALNEMFLNQKFLNQHLPDPPDFFLFTDYLGPYNFVIAENTEIYSDEHTIVSIDSFEELPELNSRVDPEILEIEDGSKLTNNCVLLNIKIVSDELGEFFRPVIYAFAGNEYFCSEMMLENEAKISHIIHNNYGGGCGGGGHARGGWIVNVINKLNCELLIAGHIEHFESGDEAAMQIYPSLAGNNQMPPYTKTEFEGVIGGAVYYGRNWYLF